ncbi:MAG: 30S ribosomal protein S27ae [Candidatus Aenigmarchaeota archaeon]|nr:30S ribosomal protein S27ae [Candidatus Aenigmarchaeota archaeon]
MPKKVKSKSKHKNVKQSEKYEVSGDKLTRKFKSCPKCKKMLATHTNRLVCGSCGFKEVSVKKE